MRATYRTPPAPQLGLCTNVTTAYRGVYVASTVSRVRPSVRPRLLIVTPDFPPTHGGIQVLAHRLACCFDAFDTEVLTLASPGAEAFDASSALAIRRVGFPREPRLADRLALSASAVRRGLRGALALTLNLHAVTSPAAAAVRALTGASTVQYFYANEIAHRPRLAAFAARRADAAIAISSYTAGLLAARGVSAESLTVIPPGVDLPADPSPLATERPTVVTVARMTDSYKGHDVLARALPAVRERVPDVEWVVVGDGPLRPTIEAHVSSLGVAESVRFTGALGDTGRDLWLRRADVFAMPSRPPGDGLAGEGFGIVYTEAGAFGKPVVAGNVGGALDAVADGQTGLLVDPADPAAVAAAIVRLLEDRELATRLGAEGARRAAALSWPAIAQRVQAVMLGLLAPADGVA